MEEFILKPATIKMFHQMQKNPKIVISPMADSQWIRITRTAILDNSDKVKEVMLEAIPELKDVYNAEDLVVYYFENMVASLCSFTSELIKLDAY